MNPVYIIIIVVLLLISLYLAIALIKTNKDKLDIVNAKNQFNKVLDSIQQSILLFNNENKLMFYNKHSLETLHFGDQHLALTTSEIFNNVKMDEAFTTRDKYRVFDINYERKIYLVHVYAIDNNTLYDNNVHTIVILNNVTEARKIEQTKKDFFSHASHELKSPLTAILGYSELVTLKIVEPEEYQDIIQRIYNQATHMSLLVEDMSILSRLETILDDEEDRKNINLTNVLNDTIYTLEPFLMDKNIDIVINSENSVYFKCVQLDLNKLFKNLIENAIKYSAKNSQVIVNLKNEKNNIYLEVIDQGIGIDQIHIDRIFERFYRIDKGRLEPGTGLGLAIVKHTVLKYHGEVSVDSVIKKGTKITIKLPTNK